ncbi:MAG: hypothetical protein ACI9X0_002257 [Kiritimatiellia bacterium]|jgi:hypothetical protein
MHEGSEVLNGSTNYFVVFVSFVVLTASSRVNHI